MIDLTGKVLVVVDMQPGYKLDMTDAQVDVVEALIREAISVDALIVFLEFADQPTLPHLLRACRRYDMFSQQAKQCADGSDEVLTAQDRNDYEALGYVVCGVETHCCVAATAENLALEVPGATVEVVKEGCGSREGNRWDEFPKQPNLTLASIG